MDTHRIEILRRSRKETKEWYDYQQSYLICTLIKEGHEVTVRRYRYKIEDRSITLHVLKIDNNEVKEIKPEYTDNKNEKRAKNQEEYIRGMDTMCEILVKDGYTFTTKQSVHGKKQRITSITCNGNIISQETIFEEGKKFNEFCKTLKCMEVVLNNLLINNYSIHFTIKTKNR
ncbi:hypothetical protein EIN_150610 [Entamoeba invadens IP1]|uniref:Uncharacterized protein n=1 Tax=Entamoeba invadens IP1 TaxID=370355 RepID=A0A0A1U8F7_ENTIV|nr:hypothetical protein EIN_150610 [Entamoeba invadens IP1]ELP91194.1 hypothetical protein EIN_150610 [Entamoeba invadens IP1]|eukprot:XP_004257965.1 hypothetical protein EIN_150610 [Entamoeba invadens IP1]